MKNKVVVFGSFVVDLTARAEHLPIQGETVKGDMFQQGPGGKGFNQGVAAHKSGTEVTMVTKLGKDSFADIALNTMDKLGMTKDYIFQSDDENTGVALIMVDENTGQNQILVAPGACNNINDDEVEKIEKEIRQAPFLLTQLETNMSATEKVIDIAFKNQTNVILNPAPFQKVSDELLKKIYLITPNEVEAECLSGIPIKSIEDADKACDYFFEKGVQNIIITLGEKGAYLATKEERELLPPFKVDALDTTGAGDAFNGGLLAALAEGKDLKEAAYFANALAAISVTRLGTTPSMPTRQEIDEFINERKGNRND